MFLKLDFFWQAQHRYEQANAPPAQQALTYPAQAQTNISPAYGAAPPAYDAGGSSLYPSLEEYMGLTITSEMVKQNMPVAIAQEMQVGVAQEMQVGVRQTSTGNMQVAPITGNSVGLARAEIKQGVREVLLCKDGDGKVGLRVRSVNKVNNYILLLFK